MKIVTILLFYLMTINVANAQSVNVHGRIIDEKMQNLLGATIINLKSKQQTTADTGGFYFIDAMVGDTLLYKWIGCTPERRIVSNKNQHINVLLIDKSVNDLGAVWSKKQWMAADRQTSKKYKKIEKQATQSGKWNY